MNDGYCNGGNLPGTYIIRNQRHYQDYEWYEALEDGELKNEALRNKAIMEGLINEGDDESRFEQERRWNIYTNYDDAYEINHGDDEREELCEVHELPVCNIRRYIMIKYSFYNNEEYVDVKEDEYDDLTITRKEACRAYQEIFRIMDDGWKGASFIQGMIPSIPIGGSISLEGFLLPVLLLVVIIVMVGIVIVIFDSVVDEVSLYPPSAFVFRSLLSCIEYAFYYADPLTLGYVVASSQRVPVGPMFLLGLLLLAIDAACAFRAEEMPSLISCWMAAKVMAGVSDVDSLWYIDEAVLCANDGDDNVVEEEDGEWIRFLGGNSSSGIKKYRGLNSSDGGNTEVEVKIAGGVIGSGGEINDTNSVITPFLHIAAEANMGYYFMETTIHKS
ncbi:hypothetical protein Tco_0201473 [Tanacetum coccineum]